MANISFSIFSSPERLTKQYSTHDGELVMDGASNWVNRVAPASAENLVDLLGQLDSLTQNQCVGWGIAHPEITGPTQVVKKDYRKAHGGLARTAECFNWPSGPAVLMLDLDMPHTPESARVDILEALKLGCNLDAEDCEMVWRPSSSNGVYVDDPTTAKKSGRIYMVASHGGDIRTIGQSIEAALWASDKGYIRVSVSGKPLTRCLVDTCVWQPERLDYVAPAVLTGAAVRNAAEPVFWNPRGKPLGKPKRNDDTRRVFETAEVKKKAAKVASEPECKRARSAYIDELCARGITREAALVAADGGKLVPGFKLRLATGELVDVGDILDNLEQYHKTEFYDPFEPTSDGRIAILYTNRVPMLYSQMHAGTVYLLQRVAKHAVPVPAVNPESCALTLVGHLQKYFKDQVFLIKEGTDEPRVVWITNNAVCQVTPKNLGFMLSTQMEFTIEKKHKVVEVTLPNSASENLFKGIGFNWINIPKLRGVSNRPWLNPKTGEIFSEVGYDSASQLYLSGEYQFEAVSPMSMQDRMSLLLAPYDGFEIYDMDDKISRGYTDAQVLGLQLSFASRFTVLTPSFGVSCADPGAGKTYLGSCAHAENGIPPLPVKWARSPEEQTKILGSVYDKMLPSIFLDNADGAFESADLNLVLAANIDVPAQMRRLGSNTFITCFNNLPVIITGINVSFGTGAEARRFILLNLAPKARHRGVGLTDTFADPLGHIKDNWQERHMHRLALFLDYAKAGFPRWYGQPGNELPENFKAFPDYDRWVRGLVYHLTGIDIVAAIDQQTAAVVYEQPLPAIAVAMTVQWLYCASLWHATQAAAQLKAGHEVQAATLRAAGDATGADDLLKSTEQRHAATEAAIKEGQFACITGEALTLALAVARGETVAAPDTVMPPQVYDSYFVARAQKFSDYNEMGVNCQGTIRNAIKAGTKNGLVVLHDETPHREGKLYSITGAPMVLPSRLTAGRQKPKF